MPGFGLNQEDEMLVWDMGYKAASAAGYESAGKKGVKASPLAATSFVAGFMARAFIGKLYGWTKTAFEPNTDRWISEGFEAGPADGRYMGMPFEANTAGESPEEEKRSTIGRFFSFVVTAVTGSARSDEEYVNMVVGDLDDEIWRPIVYYPGGFVSNCGRVRDWKGIRRPWLSSSCRGYPRVLVPYGNAEPVHRVVAETWLGPRPKNLVTCHRNDNKLDARLENLRYDTSQANVLDRIRNERERVARGKLRRREAPPPEDEWFDDDESGYRERLAFRSSASKNGEYRVFWSEGWIDGDGELRGDGEVRVEKRGNELFSVGFARPYEARVANDGTTLVVRTNDDEDKSFVVCLRADGSTTKSWTVGAEPFLCGLSESGSWGALVTGSLGVESRVDRIYLYDLRGAKQIWIRELPTLGFDSLAPVRAEFDEKNSIVCLHREKDMFRFSLDGRFLDEALLERAELSLMMERGWGGMMLETATRKLKEIGLDPEGEADYQLIEDLLRRTLASSCANSSKARAHRHLGEIAERRGHATAAIEHFEQALSLDPLVGVKKKLSKLRDSLRPE